MITINLIDGAFAHQTNSSGHYSISDNRIPTYIKYVRNQFDWGGITVFTDKYINKSSITNVNSKIKLLWLIEPREIINIHYENAENCIDLVDYIITYDEYLLAKYPDKVLFAPYGSSWIEDKYMGIYEKNKNISMIFSHKILTNGHRLRHQIANNISGVDLYGTGTGIEFKQKEEFLPNYRFSIEIENTRIKNYFSEKIIDCFALGTIPVYCGCTNIDDFFNKDGIIRFSNFEELKLILPTLTDELYESKLSAITDNFKLVDKFKTPEDWIYENIYKKIHF